MPHTEGTVMVQRGSERLIITRVGGAGYQGQTKPCKNKAVPVGVCDSLQTFVGHKASLFFFSL